MHIAICEDEAVYQTAIVQAIRCWQMTGGRTNIKISVFQSSEELLEQLNYRLVVDLLFIDIKIPGEINGIELAQRIRETHLDVTIVFCTNYGEYVYKGYTVNALRFLRKPVVEDEVFFCCDYVYNRLPRQAIDTLTVLSSGRRYVFRHCEIKCIEVRGHHLYLSTTIRLQPLKLTARLLDIRSSLPDTLFVYCHRSYIVNVSHINVLTRTQCILTDGITIPISRTYAADVYRVFDLFHHGCDIRYGLDSV